ncbi:hypothetical protein [Amycolatopsis benzoatilytica]|uniref:hypothetical protein n=1 Tax=Amycolatopsis benzoatilytica TaxID=346045 RepID=UPI00037FE097|nr:hypothetical protein [Amycolatopsis benzoatilytica]
MRTGEVLVRRAVAVVSAAGGLGHLAMAGASWTFAVMAALCLPCAVHLWRRGSRRAWAMAAFGAVGMVAAHLALLVHSPGGSPHHHFAAPAMLSHPTAHLLPLTAIEALVVIGALWAAPSPSRPFRSQA